jgi:uncharacterized protein (DUF885 family)
MCDPLSIGMGALSVGGAAANHIGQSKASKQNKKSAIASYTEDVKQLNLRGLQEQAAAMQSLDAASLQNKQESGLAVAGASAANVAGNSVAGQAQTLDRGFASFTAGTLDNLSRMLSQIEQEKRASAASTQSRINQMPAPSIAATAITAGTGLVSEYDRYLLRRKPK